MNGILSGKKMSSFQIMIAGFTGLILAGTLMLMMPAAVNDGSRASLETALFTSTSAVCVTGLEVKDTAIYWSAFGQAVILILIQIGGLGVAVVAAMIAMISGRKISLLQRNVLQDSMSAHQLGGMVKMTMFIVRTALAAELIGALLMMPAFCRRYGVQGIWMAVFHSVSAFCNAGFDIMGSHTGAFSSLTSFSADPAVVLPVCLLIMMGGIGYLTWKDVAVHRLHFRKYRMQSKVIFAATAVLVIFPVVMFFAFEYTAYGIRERFLLSLFQAVTPRTAGFNTADLSALAGPGRMMVIILMLIGGSPGSTAGGMKTTSAAVLLANAAAVFKRKKDAQLFGRRIEDSAIRDAASLLLMYLFLALSGAVLISAVEQLPVETCLFETASAIGTVGLSLGITPSLGIVSQLVLIFLMFFGRVGGLTIIYAAVAPGNTEISKRPVEKIIVG